MSAPPGSRSCRHRSCARQRLDCRRSASSELLRHFNRLARLNQAIDSNFYPLGSCTMKYNPKVNEWAARRPGFAQSHPLDSGGAEPGQPRADVAAGELLKEISGFEAVSLQPAAGAQGELTGMLMTRAYHRDRGEGERGRRCSSGLVARHEPGDGHDGRLPDRHDPLERARRDRPRRAARGARPGRRRPDDHEPEHAGDLRGPDRPGGRRGPRRRGDRVHGWREPERDPRPLPPGRGRLRRHALQPAQDLQHPARRRGTGRRAGRRRRAPRALPPEADAGAGRG